MDSLLGQRKQFLKDTEGEKEKKAFSTFRRLGAMALRLSSVVSPERQAAVDVYNRGSFGCKSPFLTQSHSINCFRAKLQVSLWNLKKFKRQAGGRAGSRSDNGEEVADRRRGQHKAKPSTFTGGKKGGKGEEKGSAIATEGGRSKCDPESAAPRLPHANSTPSAALTNDF